MNTVALSALSDISVVIFDLLIYTQLIEFRKDTPRHRRLVYGGCGLIVLAYLLGTYIFGIPASTGMVVFMTIPSLLIFFLASKYRDARFFLTFCFVDTVTLVVGFFSRWLGIAFGAAGQLAGLAVLIAAFVALYRAGKPYFKKYRQLLDYTKRGWLAMMVSSAIIYVMLAVLAAYPKPLVQRPEYLPAYGLVCIAVLAHYTVMLISISKNKRLFDQHRQMEKQQKWYHIAYWDALTGASNRAAYMEYVNELERRCAEGEEMQLTIAVADLDDFKQINDRYGHIRGDEMLRDFARLLMQFFPGEESRVFRIGGDEFAVISAGVSEETLMRRFEGLRTECGEACAFSVGCCRVDPGENNAIERAFERADQVMYARKRAGLNR